MAASSRDSINQRITLTGDDEVRRKLEQIGATGEQSFKRASASSGQLGFALRNLSFQANDVFTSIASGQGVMRTFAQQGGQIAQAFQEGGGLSNVLGAVGTKLKEMITPMRALAGVGAAAAAGVAVLAARSLSADSALRQFKVTLDALRPPAFAKGGDILKGLGVSPENLEAAAQRLRSAGLSISEARKEILDAVRAGVDPKLAEQVVRFGKDLDAAFGEKGAKSADAFVKAIQGGPEALRKFGQDIGAINPNVSALQDGLRTVPSLLKAIVDAPNIKGAADALLDPLQRKARDVNVEFQNLLDKMTLFGKEGFVNLVTTGRAAGDVFKSLFEAIRSGNLEGLAAGLDAAFAPIRNLGASLFETIRTQLAAPDPLGLTLLATSATANIQQLFQTLGQTAMDALVSAFGGTDPFASLVTKAQAAAESIKTIFQGILDKAAAVGQSIFNSISQGSAEFPRFAAGGLVTGPGTGTSDSVFARLSDGEFVVNAASTRQNLPLLEALNRLNAPLVSRSRGFAAGGQVSVASAAASKAMAAAHFHFGDGSQGTLHGAKTVVDALRKEARRSQILSAGRKQSFVGGRRYGG